MSVFELPDEELRSLGLEALEAWLSIIRHARSGRVTPGVPLDVVQEVVRRPWRDEPQDAHALIREAGRILTDFGTFNGSPRFFGYITGAPTQIGPLAEWLACAANPNIGGWRLSPAATEIELQTLDWFKEVFGFPSEAAGLFTSGGAMANFTALAVARDASGWDVRRAGVAGGPPLRLYMSEEGHDTLSRAWDLLGLGTDNVVKIPIDAEFRMDVAALERAITADRTRGFRPRVIAGTAGTVGTGAIDPLSALAAIAKREGLWFHVDGAYGGPAILDPGVASLMDGIAEADSLIFDPHKWLYAPLEAGCVLIRDGRQLREAFTVHPAYVYEEKARLGERFDFFEHSPQFSAGFKGFKVWMALLQIGRRGYAERIARDIALARMLREHLQDHPRFEVLAHGLSIVCFRYVPQRLRGNDEALDAFNQQLMEIVQEDGRVFCSNASIRGRTALRACIVNYHTTEADVRALIDVCEELGQRLDKESAG